jgi:hypothetical protein
VEATLKIKAVIETAIYVDDLDDAEDFYRTILGLLAATFSFRWGRPKFCWLSSPKPRSRATCCRRMEPPGRAISRWELKQTHWTVGGSICKIMASRLKKKWSGPEGVSLPTFVTLRRIWWNWLRLGYGDCRVGGERGEKEMRALAPRSSMTNWRIGPNRVATNTPPGLVK